MEICEEEKVFVDGQAALEIGMTLPQIRLYNITITTFIMVYHTSHKWEGLEHLKPQLGGTLHEALAK